MEMHSVQSSNINAIGYDEGSETLQIEFINGGTYQYFDVPQHVFDGIMNADSKGKFLHSNIKGAYRYSRV